LAYVPSKLQHRPRGLLRPNDVPDCGLSNHVAVTGRVGERNLQLQAVDLHASRCRTTISLNTSSGDRAGVPNSASPGRSGCRLSAESRSPHPHRNILPPVASWPRYPLAPSSRPAPRRMSPIFTPWARSRSDERPPEHRCSFRPLAICSPPANRLRLANCIASAQRFPDALEGPRLPVAADQRHEVVHG